jgi:hypothetical protein
MKEWPLKGKESYSKPYPQAYEIFKAYYPAALIINLVLIFFIS